MLLRKKEKAFLQMGSTGKHLRLIQDPICFLIKTAGVFVFALALQASVYGAETEGGSAVFIDQEEVEQPVLEFTGLLRNDSYYIWYPSNPLPEPFYKEHLFSNLLETRLVAERKRKDWNFYADARIYHYSGEAATARELAGLPPVEFRLMRSFGRFFSPVGDFTFGKTYVNVGNKGLFNPFEIDKTVHFNDISYDLEGNIALEYYLPWMSTAGMKSYMAIPAVQGVADPGYALWGLAPGFHLGSFELGGVVQRQGEDLYAAGGYFKGDLILGVEGSWAARFDHLLKYQYSELSAGIDYSFFNAKVVANLIYYYNENGGESPDQYTSDTGGFLQARHYLFSSVSWIMNEFWSLRIMGFYNITDQSFIILPSVNTIFTGGLSLYLQVSVPYGASNSEFAPEKGGDLAVLTRLEGKF